MQRAQVKRHGLLVCCVNEHCGVPGFQVERGSRAVGVAGAARSRRRGHGPGWRGRSPALDALGTAQASRRGGQEKQAKRRAACTPDDRGRLAPLPSGKGRGGWESVGLPGWLVQRAGGGLPFLPNLAAVANRCGLFLAWAVELRPGALSGPLWGPRYGVRPKAEGRSPWGCRAGARSAGEAPKARRSRRGEAPRGGGAFRGAQSFPQICAI